MKGEILMIDDNPLDLKIAVLALERSGYACHAYTDPNEGIAWAENNRPQLIFLDLQMPGVSGYKLIEIFRRFPQTAKVPILIVSGMNQIEDVKKAIALGANDYIIKPIDALVLQEKAQKVTAGQNDFVGVDVEELRLPPVFFARKLEVVSVSEFGLRVSSSHPLAVGEVVELAGLGKSMGLDRLFVRCLSADRAGQGESWTMQLTFVGMPEKQRQSMRNWCRQLWIESKESKQKKGAA